MIRRQGDRGLSRTLPEGREACSMSLPLWAIELISAHEAIRIFVSRKELAQNPCLASERFRPTFSYDIEIEAHWSGPLFLRTLFGVQAHRFHYELSTFHWAGNSRGVRYPSDEWNPVRVVVCECVRHRDAIATPSRRHRRSLYQVLDWFLSLDRSGFY
jgi:hypothetical protein